MAEQRFNPENIIELAEQLRLAGFDIGTQQHIAAQDLLIALAAHNRLPVNPSQWRTLLAPIFCASPAEQEEFYARFDQWLKRHPEWIPVADELAEPGSREITLPAASILWLRKPVGIASVVLLILLIGFGVFLSLKTNRALTVEVFSSEGGKPLPDAKVEFFNQPAKSEGDGKFTINYRARNWHRIFNRQVANLTVIHGEHDPHPTTQLDVHRPSHQTVTLQKRKPQAPEKSTITLPPTAEATPPPIPLLQEFNSQKPEVGKPNMVRWYHWLLVISPLLLFAAWMLLRWRRRRSLLQKLQAAGSPNLRRLKVRGASERLFQSQAFRRAVQDLRRHRRVGVRDLDVHATVQATIDRGGMFAPRYGSRKALPEYLLLIDRANLADEQARFADELSQRLEDGGVFVDRFYFQSDPRTCRPREANSATVTLLDLAARYPEHQLLVFSDGEGFISPLTGEAEHWVTMFSHWPGKVFLTPELASQPGYRELALMENDFLVLPANDDGLFILTETISAGMTPNLKATQRGKGENSLFPRLVMEHPRRWVERHAPRPAAMSQLLDQLRAYLGEDGWYWLAACAVYPALSWDVTLYLGYKLIGVAEDFEDRLLRLIRLPWFRYGSMPDWLRLRLIESFSPAQESEVRQAIETMLLSALENPQEGIPLEIAEREPVEVSWLQRLKAKLDVRRQRKKLADLIEREPEESPLKDFVFLGFLTRASARRLTVKLPDLLNRLLFPEGQAVLGFRPATAAALAILLAVAGAFLAINWSQRIAPPPPTISQFYQDWDQIEQSRFVADNVKQVLTALADKADTALSVEDYELIQQKVSDYAVRVGNGFTSEAEDLSYVFGRGVKYAPEISAVIRRMKQRELPNLYLEMLKSEFRHIGPSLFLLLRASRVSGVSSDGVLRNIAGTVETSGNVSPSLNMMNGSVWKLLAYDNQQERAERADYVYRFLAAAIVGENPRKFGLDMNPLSSYAQAGLVSPSPTPSATPTPTPTPRSVACLTDKDLQGEYVVRSIGVKDANGQIKDISNVYPMQTYLRTLYSRVADLDSLLSDAKLILEAEKIVLSSPAICLVRSNTTQQCKGAIPSTRGLRPAQCMDVILTSGTPTGKDGQSPVQGPPPAFSVTETATSYSVSLGEGVRPLELVKLTGGQFTMGSDKGETDEKPPHRVQVSPFAMGKFEVTQAQWKAVMDGKNPSNFKGDDLPVEQVSWNDAVEFCKKLSAKTGYNFRLPTEAEWEYAARGGTQTEYSFGDDPKLLGEYAWYGDNSESKTQRVGTRKQNPFGLFDMHGNVWEWCSDRYGENYYNQLSKQRVAVNPRGPAKGDYRVVRGGSWYVSDSYCRSAVRNYYQPGFRNNLIGFRLVL